MRWTVWCKSTPGSHRHSSSSDLLRKTSKEIDNVPIRIAEPNRSTAPGITGRKLHNLNRQSSKTIIFGIHILNFKPQRDVTSSRSVHGSRRDLFHALERKDGQLGADRAQFNVRFIAFGLSTENMGVKLRQ